MNRHEIIARLRQHEAALRARGVAHRARRRLRVCRPQGPLASLSDGRVDVIDREGLKPFLRPAVTAQAVYAL
jgi:hypothetical protein